METQDSKTNEDSHSKDQDLEMEEKQDEKEKDAESKGDIPTSNVAATRSVSVLDKILSYKRSISTGYFCKLYTSIHAPYIFLI